MKNENILKEKDIITEGDYEKMMITRQYNKLYEMSKIENKKQKQDFKNERFYNLSFSQLGTNLSITFMEILNEFVVYMNEDSEVRNTNDLFIIFTKEGRLIYIEKVALIIHFITSILPITICWLIALLINDKRNYLPLTRS